MARKKKKKIKISFFGQKKKRKKKNELHISMRGVLKAAAVVFVIAAIGIGFVFLDRSVVFDKHATLTLINPPSWATEELKSEVFDSAKALGENLKIVHQGKNHCKEGKNTKLNISF